MLRKPALLISACLAVAAAFTPGGGQRAAAHRTAAHAPRTTRLRAAAEDDEAGGAADADLPDWRELRARLVAREAADGIELPVSADGAYAFESPLIEQGSVILGGTEQSFGFALRQQYFHKSAMLLLQHDETFTKGIILNRPSALELDGWRVWFGGDVAEGGMFRGEKAGDPAAREIVCLHQLSGEIADRLSIPILPGVSWTNLDGARALVDEGVASKGQFWVFVGYAGWGPGQLQRELERDSWFLASADSDTLLTELLEQGTELQGAGLQRAPPGVSAPSAASGAAGASAFDALSGGDGLATWEKLMRSIGRGEQAEGSRGSLADRTLAEWARAYLLPRADAAAAAAEPQWPASSGSEVGAGDDATAAAAAAAAAAGALPGEAAASAAAGAAAGAAEGAVGVGAVLRCGAQPADRFLLSDQFLLKSLLLVLLEVPGGAGRPGQLVCCTLNRPTASLVELHDGRHSRRCINYGGDGRIRGGRGAELDIDDNGLLWLHTRPDYGGTPVGGSGVYRLPSVEAAEKIKAGTARLDEFLLVSGVCAFARDELEVMVAAGELAPVENAKSLWPALWGLADADGRGDEGGRGGAGLSDGSAVWWAAAQKGGGGASGAAVGAADGAAAGADGLADGPGLQAMAANGLADECLAEWLKFFAGHTPAD